MPYAICPTCGTTMHLRVGDPASWYAERHPDAPFGELVPEPCLFCFGELAAGDRVVTRRFVSGSLAIEPGQRGVMRAIYTNREGGSIYAIDLDAGKNITVPRAAIRKRREGED